MECWSREEWRELEARVNRVVAAWGRLDCEPSFGRDDLTQELFLRSWEYWQKHHAIPSENLLRDWSWTILRTYGFKGGTRQDLASPSDCYGAPVEKLEADENGEGNMPAGHPRLVPAAEWEALRELFWEKASPALRTQLEELATARNWTHLAELWGFSHVEECKRYVRGPLRRRLEREGLLELLEKIVRDA